MQSRHLRKPSQLALVITFIAMIVLSATPVAAWSGITSPPLEYEWKYDGGIFGTFSVNKTTGYIRLKHDQTSGSSSAIAILGAKITTPNTGSSWTIEFRISYLCYYEAGGLFWGTYSLWTTIEISDANHNNVLDSYEDLAINNQYSGSSHATRQPTYQSSISLDPDTDYYLDLVVEWGFHGWVWMHEYPGYGSAAEFDVTAIYWTFTEG